VARDGWGGAVAIHLEPTLDRALGVDPIEADADGLELPTLRSASDRLGVQPQQLGQLARLVVPFDHRLVSRVRLEGKLGTVVETSEAAIVA
jgi:hypothetical protein